MHASTLFIALIAGLLPSLIWLWFWLREDTHAEPRSLILSCFFGGAVAVFIALFAEKYVAEFISSENLRYTAWALIEEVAKFIAVGLIAFNSINYDEPIDAMIYCIAVALGFAALENMFFLIEPLSNSEVAKSIVTGNMRFLGATLVHIVSSAIVGFAIGLVYYRKTFIKVIAAIIGLITATALHSAFNLSIINGSPIDALKSFAWLWGAVVILIILFEEIKVVRPKFT